MKHFQSEPLRNLGSTAEEPLDAIIVGAGFAGLYMLDTLLRQGCRVQVLEAAAGVGGTWLWNRYPGARCDVESVEYSYSFDDSLQREWTWSERYSTQPEILRYLNHVADRFALRRHIRFGCRVQSARYDRVRSRWLVVSEDGQDLTGRFLIMATGCLSAPRRPSIPGAGGFRGLELHTGLWPSEDPDFRGMKVGVIGTGSSGIQCIPPIAEQAEHLHVFQRTPNYSVPANNGPPVTSDLDYPTIRELARGSRTCLGRYADSPEAAVDASPPDRRSRFEERWAQGSFGLLGSYRDLLTSEVANEELASFVRGKMSEELAEPSLAEALIPSGYPIGTKRLAVHPGDYFATYRRPNVTLVDTRRTPLQEITEVGVRASDRQYELDAIVYATGFDAMTGAVLSIDIEGRDGQKLRQKWAAGPRTYLGLAVAGFPNLFMITGPGSPSVLTNMVCSIEQHVEWIGRYIDQLMTRGVESMEPTDAAEERWVKHVNSVADKTLYPRAASWYLGANVPGKPRVFMPYVGGAGAYRKLCDRVEEEHYSGFCRDARLKPLVVGLPLDGAMDEKGVT